MQFRCRTAYQGVLYRVTMKNGREETLVQIANSAIEAGPR